MNLDTPIGQLNRVGKTLEKRLEKLGISKIRDLLFYFPFRYEDFSKVSLIKDLRPGEEVSIKGKIEMIASKRSPRARKIITEAVVADETDRLRVVWFGQPYISKVLKVGDSVYLSGKVTEDMFGAGMTSPAYEKEKNSGETAHTARIVPMYPLTAGLTQKQIRFMMAQVVDLSTEVCEWLPEEVLQEVKLISIAKAIRGIHFPENFEAQKEAERRLKFDELFVLQLQAELVRRSLDSVQAPKLFFKEAEIKNFVLGLPFSLTKSQKVAAWEILQDIEKETPMNRLLEGDVGSGKTVAATIALYNAGLNEYQAVFMAPTEILAGQHYESLIKLLEGKARICLLTRSQFLISNLPAGRQVFKFSHPKDDSPLAENNSKNSNDKNSKRELMEQIKKGNIDIIIGTHALLSEKVEFKKLGLIIVDEQHRFGVEQRKLLKDKAGESGLYPHFLSMTATPIPRSLALTLYGDLDLSIINEMPVGRKIIKTRLVDPHNREKAYEFIREQVKQGRQVFVVCPLIEETDHKKQIAGSSGEKKSVLSEYDKLSKRVFSDLSVGYLHGKLKSKEKEETMQKFAAGEIDILVSTSVVEVGVNIPNASVMMIEGADRFGLAQLHQFRGRVGRSVHQSYCFLFTDNASIKVQERLSFFEKNTDGFKLAEYDLEERGPGVVYGTDQSGLMNLKLATMRDGELIKLAREAARGIDFDKYPVLLEKVREWEKTVHLE